ncbi:MAG: cytochrome c [Gammaproteobacteria bacterium]|nr:cytochrome c [Gammaproteobacteria bacterium]
MRGARIRGAVLPVAATLAALGAGAALFVFSGIYDIGADDHHTAPVTALIGALRERSIAVRAAALAVPDLSDAAHVAAGARTYALHCAGCHLAPGVNRSDLSSGLYPHPPDLAQQAPPEARRAFWVVKHGIKMSAMPAWGRTLDDAALWDLVAFVRRLPAMSEETYERMTR